MEKYVKCPNCGEETEVVIDLDEEYVRAECDECSRTFGLSYSVEIEMDDPIKLPCMNHELGEEVHTRVAVSHRKNEIVRTCLDCKKVIETKPL